MRSPIIIGYYCRFLFVSQPNLYNQQPNDQLGYCWIEHFADFTIFMENYCCL